MARRVLCPVLVGRDETLSELEDALLAAGRGEGRLVGLGGEAGVGKTRVVTELAARAAKLGFEVMWGGCSEVELQLPYLPFIEAVGNWIAETGAEPVGERLGPVRRELAQLFPQLSDGGVAGEAQGGGDAGQAKLRLLEAMVSLLSIPARERGLLLVLEDIHWADGSTREMLDHLSRRMTGERALILTTYRSDELERRHPLRPLVQAWRRADGAEIITMDPLPASGVASMIRAILDVSDVSEEFRDLMHGRSEGNPFVLEEMLKEAIDREDVFRTADGWDRKPVHEMRLPETVRETILLRLARLPREDAAILEAASVLGRVFEYPTLVAVSGSEEPAVMSALEVATAQQLLDEDEAELGRFRWRHALTQEAIYDEIVAPRRQLLHSRSADALAGKPDRDAETTHHLFGAGRFDEAVTLCLTVAQRALQSLANHDAIQLLERALPHTADPVRRARVLGLLGSTLAIAANRRAVSVLEEAIRACEENGLVHEAASSRLSLGRVHWELGDTERARTEFEAAREALAQGPASGELAVALLRLAGLSVFEFDHQECVRLGMEGAEVAAAAGAEFERIWSLSFAALGLVGLGRVTEGFDLMRRTAREAENHGFLAIVQNVCWNEIWVRMHLLMGGFEPAIAAMSRLPASAAGSVRSAHSYVALTAGDIPAAIDLARESITLADGTGRSKFRWRANVQLSNALLAAGRVEEAQSAMPGEDTRVDLQDVVYDAQPRIELLLTAGRVDEAVEQARLIRRHAAKLACYGQTALLAVRALLEAGLPDEARELLDAWKLPGEAPARPWLDEARGLLALASGEPEKAAELFASAAEVAGQRGAPLVQAQMRLGLARAWRAAGRVDEATETAIDVAERAGVMGAARVRRDAVALAGELGVAVVDEPAVAESGAGVPEPAPVEMGERMITSMFADIREYTPMTRATAPAAMADTLTALYRWAKTEVERQNGIVDKFAGDAVMATFNVSGATVDHCLHALQAAMALRDKAALSDVGMGAGIAVGPAVVSSTPTSDANMMVMGTVTNLAARLQASAGTGEIMLSAEAYRRVAGWLEERGIGAERESIALKGFDEPVEAYRIRAPVRPAE